MKVKCVHCGESVDELYFLDHLDFQHVEAASLVETYNRIGHDKMMEKLALAGFVSEEDAPKDSAYEVPDRSEMKCHLCKEMIPNENLKDHLAFHE
jgi:hypothetical protein